MNPPRVNTSGHSGLCASLLSSVLVEPFDPRRLLGMVNVASTFTAGYAEPSLGAAGSHRAFVVGINDYGSNKLTKPVDDASDMSALLEAKGFSVWSSLNPSRSRFVESFDMFCGTLAGARSVVVHFSGHGLAPSSEIFLVASDSTGVCLCRFAFAQFPVSWSVYHPSISTLCHPSCRRTGELDSRELDAVSAAHRRPYCCHHDLPGLLP
jgi:hypothetical protein